MEMRESFLGTGISSAEALLDAATASECCAANE